MKNKESKSKFVSAARARFFQKTRGTSNISTAEHVFDTSASLQLKWRSLLQQSPDYANLVEYTFLHFTSFSSEAPCDSALSKNLLQIAGFETDVFAIIDTMNFIPYDVATTNVGNSFGPMTMESFFY